MSISFAIYLLTLHGSLKSYTATIYQVNFFLPSAKYMRFEPLQIPQHHHGKSAMSFFSTGF
jgi:hypothetical protein